MFYDVCFSGRVKINSDSKRDAAKMVEILVGNVLNFDPSSYCSAFVKNSTEEGEHDGDTDET